MGQIFPIAVLGFKLHLRPLPNHDALRGRQHCLVLGKSCRLYPALHHKGVFGKERGPEMCLPLRLAEGWLPAQCSEERQPGDHAALLVSALAWMMVCWWRGVV